MIVFHGFQNTGLFSGRLFGVPNCWNVAVEGREPVGLWGWVCYYGFLSKTTCSSVSFCVVYPSWDFLRSPYCVYYEKRRNGGKRPTAEGTSPGMAGGRAATSPG